MKPKNLSKKMAIVAMGGIFLAWGILGVRADQASRSPDENAELLAGVDPGDPGILLAFSPAASNAFILGSKNNFSNTINSPKNDFSTPPGLTGETENPGSKNKRNETKVETLPLPIDPDLFPDLPGEILDRAGITLEPVGRPPGNVTLGPLEGNGETRSISEPTPVLGILAIVPLGAVFLRKGRRVNGNADFSPVGESESGND